MLRENGCFSEVEIIERQSDCKKRSLDYQQKVYKNVNRVSLEASRTGTFRPMSGRFTVKQL